MSNSVIEIICENCGARNKLGDKICANCGESSGLEIVPYIDKTKEEIIEEKAPIEEAAEEKKPFDDIEDIDILFGTQEEKPKPKKEGFFAKFLSKEHGKKEKAKKERESELWDLEELLDAQNGNINKIEIETVEEPIVFSDAQKEETIEKVNVETAVENDVRAVGFEDNFEKENTHLEIENHTIENQTEDVPRKPKPKYDFGDMGYARLGEELDIEPSVLEKKSKASIAMEVEDKADRVSAQEIQAEIEEQEMISSDKVDVEEIQAIEIPKEKKEKKVLRRFGQLEESSDEDKTAKADKKVELDIQPLPSYEQIRQERLERERLEKEKLERERLEQERREELVRQEQERLERERLEQERLEQERIERERQAELARLEEERQRAEREEQERLERERLEQERLEQERIERERQAELARLEEERQRAEREEQERLERERREQERLEQERIERERQAELARLEEERQRAEREEQERLERERLEQERLEQERLERERQAELARLEEERQRAEREEQERLERERLEQERLEQERIERERQAELARLEEERQQAEREEQERLERERQEQAAVEAEESSELIESTDEKIAEEKVEPEKPKYDFSDMGYTQLGEYPKVKISEHRKEASGDIDFSDTNESINIIEETPKKKRAFSIRETFFGRGKKASEPKAESERFHSDNEMEQAADEPKEEILLEENISLEPQAEEVPQSKEEKQRSFLFKRAMPSESTRLRHSKNDLSANEEISAKEHLTQASEQSETTVQTDFETKSEREEITSNDLPKSEPWENFQVLDSGFESKIEPSQKFEPEAPHEELKQESLQEVSIDDLSEEISQESSQEEIRIDESSLADMEPKHEKSSTIVAMSDFVEQMQNKNRELPQEEEKPSELSKDSISFDKIEHEITERIADDRTSSEQISDENISERIVSDEKISDREIWNEEISAEEFYTKEISEEQIVSKEVFAEEISAKGISEEGIFTAGISDDETLTEEISAQRMTNKEAFAEEISVKENSAEGFSTKDTELPSFQTLQIPQEKESEPLFEEIALSSTSEEKIVESPWRENELVSKSDEIKFDKEDEYEPVVVDFGDAKKKSSFESDFLTDVPVAPYTEPSTISESQESVQERVLGFSKDHLERFLDKNADYYIFKFNRMERSRNPISWSWSGFLFGETWLLYRKQYLIAALIYILATVTSFFIPQSSFVILGISRLLFGLLGNRIYYRYAKRELAEIDSMNDSYLQDIHIRVKGGTNIKAAIGYILLWAIFFGIMLAMALNLLPAPLGNLNLIL
ncbi:MAG: DUF2628 domain-containing protein [Peptostreptococcaceae bacterium]|nr:DUF2628 domain-containing protein [Peptostreptococcaceae bacterium]